MCRADRALALLALVFSQAVADLSVTLNHGPKSPHPADQNARQSEKQDAHNIGMQDAHHSDEENADARQLPLAGDGESYPAVGPGPADIPPAGDGDGAYAAPSVNGVPPAGPPPPPVVANEDVFETSTKAPWQKYAGPIVGGVVGAGALAGVIAVSVMKNKGTLKNPFKSKSSASPVAEPSPGLPQAMAPAAEPAVMAPESELTTPISQGARELNVKDVSGFPVGTKFIIDKGLPTEELNVVTAHGSLITKTPLQFAHEAGAKISVVLPDSQLPSAAPPSMKSAASPSLRSAAPPSLKSHAPPSLKSVAPPSLKSTAPSMRSAGASASALPAPGAAEVQAPNGGSTHSTQLVVFGAIGVCALCIALAICTICFLRKKGKQRKKARPAQETPMIPEDQMPLTGSALATTMASVRPAESQYMGMESQYLPVSAANHGAGPVPTMPNMPTAAIMPTMQMDAIPMQTMPPYSGLRPGPPSYTPPMSGAAYTASPLAATVNALPPTTYNMGQVPPTIH